MSPGRLTLNRACNVEDFAEPELHALIRELFPRAVARWPEFPTRREDRKHWEVAMAVLALRRHGALRADAELLGLGAGTEPTLFWLTNHVRRVFATDLYLTQGDWEPNAPAVMLTDPGLLYADPWRRDRLVVQHMDARALAYEDESFDGIFSSGSIEHFGELDEIAVAVDEACRVLKPGGVASFSTELRLSGPAPGVVPGLALFDRAMIEQIVIGDRPWALLDELTLELSPATAATENDIALAAADINHARDQAGGPAQEADFEYSEYPHIVLRMEPHRFTSVHLALRKHPRSRSAAAQPTPPAAGPLAARLASHLPDPLVIVDGGVRWGFGEHWNTLVPHARLIGFDADAQECARLADQFPQTRFVPLALGRASGPGLINVYRTPSSNSSYAHEESWLGPLDIPREGDHLAEVAEVQFTTLDDWCAEEGVAVVDAIKLDVQGAELEILNGAERVLASVRAVELETCFNPLFVGTPLFGEVDAFMRARGFALWRLRDLAHYPVKGGAGAPAGVEQINSYPGPPIVHAAAQGMLSWANAHYVRRDVFTAPGPSRWPPLLRDACIALSLEFFDLALVALRRLADVATPADVRAVAEAAIAELVARGEVLGH